jgi:Cytochrome P460
MREIALALIAAMALAGVSVYIAPASGQADGEASPIYGIKIPQGYRDWRLIAVAQLVAANSDDPAAVAAHMALKQLRAQLGNDIAIKAFREGTLPFPDGAMIAALHWNEVSSDKNDKVLAVGFPGAGLQSSVPESAANVQFMVKDSKKYAASGGWGFADFMNGKPGSEALHQTCFPCHQPAKDHDYVFTHYAPTP